MPSTLSVEGFSVFTNLPATGGLPTYQLGYLAELKMLLLGNLCLICVIKYKKGSPKGSVPLGEPLAYDGAPELNYGRFFGVVNSLVCGVFLLKGC